MSPLHLLLAPVWRIATFSEMQNARPGRRGENLETNSFDLLDLVESVVLRELAKSVPRSAKKKSDHLLVRHTSTDAYHTDARTNYNTMLAL